MLKKYCKKGLVFLAALALSSSGSSACFAQKFTLPIFPDTQSEINARPEMFFSQVNWLIQKRDSLNYPIVLHVGDIVDYDNHDHWKRADQGFKMLDSAGIAYALAVGNHDTEAVGVNSGSAAPGNVNQNLRKTAKFNSYFPVSRFPLQRGRYEEGKSDNSWYSFEAGGLKWMVVSLEFCSRQGPVDWANEVVAAHPDHNVIMLTHYHLNPNGDISERNAGYGDLSPAQIYDQFIKKQPNILMVLSGHVCYSSWRNDKGEHGNRIYQFLQDYQNEDFGGGYLRLLEVDTQKGTLSGRMYSPYYNRERQDASPIYFNRVQFIKPDQKTGK
ncbi:metallophosphoesterase [Arundinibacter roseus]|uniref:Metallophosphoesterase n=2 Tax=Arundinibacter roseus TaxID=2070510 RepID=A0A4R4KDR5_9BACT|nr:metallophosphoesterase [Arundinibacter roseus]